MKIKEMIDELTGIMERRGNVTVINVKGGEPSRIIEITESQLVPDVWEVYIF